MNDIGPQYDEDDCFKAKARRHQSAYRANVLKVDFDNYGNRLREDDAARLIAYYHELGIREALRTRFPNFSLRRDGDMLRSEHIVFNLIAPLYHDSELCKRVCGKAFGVLLQKVDKVQFEYAPQPKGKYLDDATAFDAYIQGEDESGALVGIGIEVKYTEKSYRIGSVEAQRIVNSESSYWRTTKTSNIYSSFAGLEGDELRQIWRNHMLGLSMKLNGDIQEFFSITIYPYGNHHIADAVTKYRGRLREEYFEFVKSISYENFIDSIEGGAEIDNWKSYLRERYLITE